MATAMHTMLQKVGYSWPPMFQSQANPLIECNA